MDLSFATVLSDHNASVFWIYTNVVAIFSYEIQEIHLCLSTSTRNTVSSLVKYGKRITPVTGNIQ